MIIRRYALTFFEANAYIIIPDLPRDSAQSPQALVVDPGAGSELWIRGTLERYGVELGAVLLTHGHADHVWDVAAVAGDKPVYVAQPDLYRLDDPIKYLGMPESILGYQRMGASSEWVKPSGLKALPQEMFAQAIELVPGLPMRAVAAPGHTEGSSVFLFSGHVPEGDGFDSSIEAPDDRTFMLSGDVIFAGSVGRTDLHGGDEYEMRASLRFLVNVIMPDVFIFPGHGRHTTMFHETRHNEFIHAAMSDL